MRLNGLWNIGCNDGSLYTEKVFCTTQLPQPVRPDDDCDSFQDDVDDGICYQIGDTVENWQQAQTTCETLGANLASVHNQQENSFIRRLAVSKGAVSGVFLGGTLSGKGSRYGWIDGSAWDYDNFYPGFPIPGLGDCLAMDTEVSSGQWVNTDCSTEMAVACQRKQSYTPPTCASGPWTEGQTIYSLGFPYDASVLCDYILEVNSGKRIEVEIIVLEANECCDHLVLIDGYIGNNVIANLTGEIKSSTYKSSSNFMRVSWQPNGGVNVRGMQMTFHGV